VEIVITHEGTSREVTLEVDDPDACVGDLLAVLDPVAAAVAAGVVVEGRFHGPDLGLDEIGLCDGQEVEVVARPPATPRPSSPRPVVAVTDGSAAGPRATLEGEVLVVGRDPRCGLAVDDATVSERHARFSIDDDHRVLVEDLGSSNGTWLDGEAVLRPTPVPAGGVVRLGAAHLTVTDGAVHDAPAGVDPLRRHSTGTLPFNRPPRPALPPEPAPLTAPDPPQSSSSRAMLSAAVIVGPLLMGGLLIWLTGNPRFALFMLMSPVMAVGNHLTQRRRSKNDTAEADRRFRRRLATLAADLEHLAAAETERRRLLLPHAGEVLRRATQPATSLWERRPGDPDMLRLRAGIGDVPWEAPVELPRDVHEDVTRLLERHHVLADAPVEVDLSDGGVVGLVGDRDAALALARCLLVQACVHHGPADLPVAVLAAPDAAADWDWAKWLPHARDPGGDGRWISGDRERSAELAGAALSAAEEQQRSPASPGAAPPGPVRCWVVDDTALLEGRRAPARLVLSGAGGPATGIVIAPTEDRLPAVCNTVVDLRSPLGDADLRRPQVAWQVRDLVICGMDDATARRCARAMARFEDPEMHVVGAGLPSLVRLLPLLGLDDVDGRELLERWRRLPSDPPPAAPAGIGEDGVVELDLRDDGPHGLIAGTTGSGKSELLRSLVAGLAARVDPEHLVFVLVDYKGGSAFDRCADLPHTVGMVTDLDEHLGERALVSLEAELHLRERLLREAGTPDLPAYLAAGSPAGPLPRLVVVIDEFATLATELPDFLGALVGIAQRGRSLGVHLILATQRPSGALNANIKANTNLRIALRVQDDSDSTDVIDRPDAARLARNQPGRAYVRRGAGDVVLVQTPLSTARAASRRASGVRLAPFSPTVPVGERQGSSGDGSRATTDTPSEAIASDLDRLVDAVGEANELGGFGAPRRPWLPMLPDRVPLAEVLDAGEADDVPLGTADDPGHQRRVPVVWSPQSGHLALIGTVGSGTTTALRAVAQAIALRRSPGRWHLYALDFGAGELAELDLLPHVGGVVAASQREAQHRLVRQLVRELERRRDLGPAHLAEEPRVVVLVDGLAAFLAEHEGVESVELADSFRRLFSEGPTVRISFVVTGDRLGAVPHRLGAAVGRRLVLRLADVGDYGAVGLRARDLPAFPPGRAMDPETKRVVQLAWPRPTAEVAAEIDSRWETAAPPLRTLPTAYAAEDLPAGTADGGMLRVPVGIADEDLAPALLELHPGEHAVVAGPPRSGRSGALTLLAHALRRADEELILVGLCRAGTPLHGLEVLDASGPPDALATVLRAAPADPRPWVVLVDDAPRFEDEAGLLSDVAAAPRGDLHVIGSARTEELRGDFGQWYRSLRRSRTGLLLQPDLPGDGDLLGVKLPRRVPVPLVAGRGFLVTGGTGQLVQVALPPRREDR
jgi:DNA segregation ATPase FtsK/SpoIIIE, S-DNA-T family